MIQTKNQEIDDTIAVILEQRNNALDVIAILTAKLKASELFSKGLQEQLEKAMKSKEGDA